MNMGLFLLSWSPVVLLAVLAVFLRRSALELSLYGFLFSLLLAIGFFKTSFAVALLSAVDGVLTTLPLFSAYLYLFLAFLISICLQRVPKAIRSPAGLGDEN